jgi:branched-chain amino acid transport system substrate-binding protein
MHVQRVTAGIAALALAVGVAACGSSSDDSDSGSGSSTTASSGGGSLPSTIKIGVPLDTSGSAAVAGVGTAEKAGVDLAVEEINSSGFLGSSRLQVEEDDTQADKQQAVAPVRRLTQDGDVAAIVGFTLTPSFMASGPIAQQAGVPVMAVGLSADGVTEVGDYIYRIYPSLSRLFARSDPQFIRALGARTVAFLYGNDTETTVGQYEARKRIADELGLTTVETQTVTAEDTDVRAQLTQIKNANPDVVFLNVNSGQQPGILSQGKELGLFPDTPLIGDVGFGSATTLEQHGDALQCATFATTYTPASRAGRNPQFVRLYEAANPGRAADDFGAWGYDAIWAVAQAIRQAGSTDHEKIRDALRGLRVSGALGDYQWDADRQPTQTGATMQIVDGKLVPWTPDSTCRR